MTNRTWLTGWHIACGVLVALSAVAFSGSLKGEAIWDDLPLINGTGIGGGKSLLHVFTRPFLDNYFRPLVSLSFFLERPIWSSGPFGYHQTNLIIHALNTGLMITLLLAAFRDRRIAFVGAALFAFHPVHVSSVAWIGGRTDPLLCLFMTCAALCLIRSADEEAPRARKQLAWAAFWYGLALLCKEQVLALLPLAPLAYRLFGNRSWDADRKRQARIAAYAFSGVAAAFIVCWFLTAPPKQSLLANGLQNYLLRAGHTFLSYAGLLFAPDATWMHAFTLGPAARYGWIGALGGYAFLSAQVALVFYAWRRGSQLAWWGLWMLLVLLPVSNLVPIATLLVAPYRAEIAQIGMAALSGWALVRLWDRFPRMEPRTVVALGGAAAAAWFLHLCLWGSAKWTRSETIFREVCRIDPDCIFARESVVQSLLKAKKLEEAGAELEELLERLMPSGQWRDVDGVIASMQSDAGLSARLRQNQGGSIDPNVWLSHIYAQLGILRSREGKKERAEVYLETAVKLDARCFDALIELGFLALDKKQYERARFWADQAVTRGPNVSDAYALRGRCHAALRQWALAEVDFEKCVELQPWAGQAYIELAEIQVKLGNREAAAATLVEALAKSPRRDDIRRRLAAL